MDRSKSGISGKGSKVDPKKSSTNKSNSKDRKKDVDKLCSDDINVPSNLPGILKAYTKGAIRTQPANLLVWSIFYFRCMQNGLVPPVKDKIEAGSEAAEGKLTVGFLRVLHKQLGSKKTVTFEELMVKWKGICQDETQLNYLFLNNKVDKRQDVEWKRILPLLATLIGKNMNDYMTMVCQVMNPRKPNTINWDEFFDMYIHLVHTLKKDANVATSPTPVTDAAKQYLQPIARNNSNLIGPDDFNDPKCPRL